LARRGGSRSRAETQTCPPRITNAALIRSSRPEYGQKCQVVPCVYARRGSRRRGKTCKYPPRTTNVVHLRQSGPDFGFGCMAKVRLNRFTFQVFQGPWNPFCSQERIAQAWRDSPRPCLPRITKAAHLRQSRQDSGLDKDLTGTSLGRVPRGKQMLKAHLPRVIYHRVYLSSRR